MKKIYVVGIIILMTALVLCGCVENKTDDTSSDDVPACVEGRTKCIGYNLYRCNGNEWILEEVNCDLCGYTSPNQDNEFMTWTSNTNNVLLSYTNNIVDALDSSSWYLVEYYSEARESLVDDIYKPECLAFKLSPQYDAIRDEYYEYLYDMSWGDFYTKLGAQDAQDGYYSLAADNIELATSYILKSTAHLKTATNMVNALIGS